MQQNNDFNTINFNSIKGVVNKHSKLLCLIEFVKLLNKLHLSALMRINITVNSENENVIALEKKERNIINQNTLYQLYNLSENEVIRIINNDYEEKIMLNDNNDTIEEEILKNVEPHQWDCYENERMFQLLLESKFFNKKKINVIDNCCNEMIFSGKKIGKKGVDYLCYRLSHFRNLTYLDLQSNNLTNEICFNSLCLFQYLPNLQNLWLSNNKITSLGLRELSKDFKYIPSLKMLGLSNNNLSGGIKYLSASLSNISNLMYLDLRKCDLEDDDVEIFCENCYCIPNLLTLNLQENKITDNVSAFMKTSLCSCPLLDKLWINRNNGIINKLELVQGMKMSHPNHNINIFSEI